MMIHAVVIINEQNTSINSHVNFTSLLVVTKWTVEKLIQWFNSLSLWRWFVSLLSSSHDGLFDKISKNIVKTYHFTWNMIKGKSFECV